MKKILFLVSLSLFASFAVSCAREAKENATSQAVVTNDVAMLVSETDALLIYKPAMHGGIELSCGYNDMPPKDTSTIFFAAAAYTKVYGQSEFNHDLVAGPHLNNGYFDGYECPANSGAFYYIPAERKWGFVQEDVESVFRIIANTYAECSGFSQVLLLYNGEQCGISLEAKPAKRALRRALCELNNELCVIDSKDKVSMYKFVESLKALGVSNGLYMDMGSMKYSAYKSTQDSDWKEIYKPNSRTQYCSNYLIFN